jgi:flavin reductase (DIM6/NTAB) family NADH-FMN oxidoreductase RutF
MKKNLGAKDLLMPNPMLVIGTYDENGRPNAMALAWAGVVSSDPPAISISMREQRKTLANIKVKQAFTVSFATEDTMKASDYVGLVSGNKGDKVYSAGLTAVHAEHVDAPYFAEYPVTLECKVMDSRKIGQHINIIGEVVNVLADEEVLDANGKIDVTKVKAIAYDHTGENYIAVSKVVGKAFREGSALH